MTRDDRGVPAAERWRDVRARAVSDGRLNEQQVAAHKERLRAAQLGREPDVGQIAAKRRHDERSKP